MRNLFVLLLLLCSCHRETIKRELTESRHIAVADGTYQSSKFEGATHLSYSETADSIITIIKTDTLTKIQKIYSPGKVIARTDTVSKIDTIAQTNTIYVRDTVWEKTKTEDKSWKGLWIAIIILLTAGVLSFGLLHAVGKL